MGVRRYRPRASIALVRVRRAAVRFAPVGPAGLSACPRSWVRGARRATLLPLLVRRTAVSPPRLQRPLQRWSSTVVAGRSRVTATIDRLVPDDSREVSARFRAPAALTGRAVPSRGCRPRDYPASAFLPLPAPAGVRPAPLRFSRRLAPAFLFFRVAGAAARVIRHRFPFSVTFRARRPFSRPGRTRLFRAPADARGVRCSLRSLDPAVRG
jgi:hypothetical protein